MIGSPWDIENSTEWRTATAERPEWFDELVDLHVLSVHGDDRAARDVARWSADDAQVALVATQLDAAHRSVGGLRPREH